MQSRTFEKIDNVAVVIGALVLSAFLIVDLSRDNAHPAWIVFDAAMLTLCLSSMTKWLPVSDTTRGLTHFATNLVVGLVLTVSFTVFAFQAVNGLQVALAVFIIGIGLFMLITEIRRVRIRRVRRDAGDRR